MAPKRERTLPSLSGLRSPDLTLLASEVMDFSLPLGSTARHVVGGAQPHLILLHSVHTLGSSQTGAVRVLPTRASVWMSDAHYGLRPNSSRHVLHTTHTDITL